MIYEKVYQMRQSLIPIIFLTKLIILFTLCTFTNAAPEPYTQPTVVISSIGDRYEEQTMSVTHKTDVFSPNTPVVHIVLGIVGLKKGTEVLGILRALRIKDKDGTLYRNIEVTSTSVKAVSDMSTFHFEFSSPTKGWPEGTYAIDVEVEGKVINRTNFTVKDHALTTFPPAGVSGTAPHSAATQDTTPPEIEIIEPAGIKNLRVEGYSRSSVKIVGYASDNEGVAAVYIRGKEALLSEISDKERASIGGRKNTIKFATEVLLKPGVNSVDLKAVDINGNSADHVLYISRKSEKIETITTRDIQNARTGKRFALLIGVSRYENREITPLRFTLKDVQELYKVLVHPKVGGFPPENVKVLTDESSEKPTAANIGLAINWLKAMARQPEDLVLIYFSGHGYSDENGSFLLTLDANPATLLTTCINVSIFNKMVAQIPARKKIIILDACHSGGMSIAARGDSPKMSRQMYRSLHDKSEGEIRFLSCKENEQSYEAEEPEISQGIFSYYLVNGLKGQADLDKNGFVLFSELEEYVQNQVEKWAALRGRSQTPVAEKKSTGIIIMSEIK